jgi:cytochrome c5
MRNFAIVLSVLAVMAIAFIVLARVIGSQVNYEDNVAQAEAIADRIAPVGTVSTSGGEAEDPAGASTPEPQQNALAMMLSQNDNQDSGGGPLLSGDKVFETACFACHATGAGGAPVLEAAAWETRLGQGVDTLVSHAIDGYQGDAGIMPPKGGRMDLSDAEIRGAVEYMVLQVQ